MPLSTPQRELLTVAETAERLHVSAKHVRRLITRGDLPAVRIGGKRAPIRIDASELERWLYGDPSEAA